MTEHPTLEPTDIVHPRTGEPTAAADTTATFTDLVCADHELLRAEFDAIITANFSDAADGTQRRPTRPFVPGMGRGTPRDAPTTSAHRQRGGIAGAQHPRARQRGPPVSRLDGSAMTARATEQAEQGGSGSTDCDAQPEGAGPVRAVITTADRAIHVLPPAQAPTASSGTPTATVSPAPHRPMPIAPPTPPAPAGHRHARYRAPATLDRSASTA
jgi:hypothetical protein